ncbi:hypothetical protein niasHT_028861 [Heterodera trifolii]|uniref:BTB domain-containing protein n=1 Tax=Heterodera trifolii TaxID=157864 RepID=A0ABD2KS55_9BILA
MSDVDTLSDRMNRLLCTGVDADVHFLVGQDDKKEASCRARFLLLPAHKPILRVSSDVFDAMFRFDEQKKGNEDPIEIPDVDIEAFKTMLSFIYTDDLSGVNGDNAIDVLYAAKKYNLPTLAKACVGIPIAKLDNVFIAFAKARLLAETVQNKQTSLKLFIFPSFHDFAGRCLAYIDRNAETLIKSVTFLQIDQKLLCEILGRDQLAVTKEIAIWDAALRWADEQCVQNGRECFGVHRREMLGPALYKIRFPIIHKDCLTSIVSSGVLTSAELVSVLLYHSSASFSEPYPLPFPIRRRTAAGKLLLKIGNFSTWHKDRKYSETVCIDGFQWKIFAQIETKSVIKYFGFFIHCDAKNYGASWSCNCSATLRIVSSKEGKADLVREFKRTFSSQQPEGFGWAQFTTFEALMNPSNGWYNEAEDTVNLSADLTVELNADETK